MKKNLEVRIQESISSSSESPLSGCLSNVMFRLGLMRKEFNITDLRSDESVYQGFEEFLSGVSY
ncbi:MAG: hypothetical protein KME59_14355 [Trichormus sp. ATA11-4-KO1]|nr:hypothetical protein [Trichormus sp. ATA11-4-KO1]